MGGLPCAKEIIDQGVGLKAELQKQFSALEKALGCMTGTITLYSLYDTPTDKQEAEFISSVSHVAGSIKATLEPFILQIADLEADIRRRSEMPQMDVGRDRPHSKD
jgi:hypothetical protein